MRRCCRRCSSPTSTVLRCPHPAIRPRGPPPRHRTAARGYLIGRTPITNASYLTFVEGGGYERREWWSDEGWSWKEQYDITRPGGGTGEGTVGGGAGGL